MEEALVCLDQHLHLDETPGPTTHIEIHASDLEHDEVPAALGRYFVGVLAGAVGQDAELSQDFLDVDADIADEVRRHIERLVGTTNLFQSDAEKRFRDTVRNPFIAEVMAHALLVLRKRGVTACLLGPTEALKHPHPIPQRQGIDVIGIYDEAGDAIPFIGEAKASRNYGSARLTDAIAFFKSLDDGFRGVEVRQELQALKNVLPDALRIGFASAIWRHRCCYLPIVVHGAPIDLTSDSEGLGALKPAQSHKRTVGLELQNFYEFFDKTADGIRVAQSDFLD
jgi:hypothetical protein